MDEEAYLRLDVLDSEDSSKLTKELSELSKQLLAAGATKSRVIPPPPANSRSDLFTTIVSNFSSPEAVAAMITIGGAYFVKNLSDRKATFFAEFGDGVKVKMTGNSIRDVEKFAKAVISATKKRSGKKK